MRCLNEAKSNQMESANDGLDRPPAALNNADSLSTQCYLRLSSSEDIEAGGAPAGGANLERLGGSE